MDSDERLGPESLTLGEFELRPIPIPGKTRFV